LLAPTWGGAVVGADVDETLEVPRIEGRCEDQEVGGLPGHHRQDGLEAELPDLALWEIDRHIEGERLRFEPDCLELLSDVAPRRLGPGGTRDARPDLHQPLQVFPGPLARELRRIRRRLGWRRSWLPAGQAENGRQCAENPDRSKHGFLQGVDIHTITVTLPPLSGGQFFSCRIISLTHFPRGHHLNG
jgi:hypothetical protein